jgi:IS5 family transposase
VHSVEYTTASVHDGQMIDDLLHGEEEAIAGDKAYDKQSRKQQCRKDDVFYGIINKTVRGKKLSKKQKEHNKVWSVIRGKVEFAYGVVKHLWGHTKTRYR